MSKRRIKSNLSIEEQICKLKWKIKFCYIFAPIWSVFVIVLSIILIVYTPVWELGAGFLVLLPFSIWLGGFVQTKHAKEEIKKLKEQQLLEMQTSTSEIE